MLDFHYHDLFHHYSSYLQSIYNKCIPFFREKYQYRFGNFYLWGKLNGKVYSNNPHTIEELITNIRNTIAEITPTELAKVAGNVLKLAELCIQVHGQQFQNLL